MKLKFKYLYNFEQFFFLLFLIILFFPKIDLIEIPPYWQGIRLEDISLAIYAIILLFNYDEKIVNNKSVKKFTIIFCYFILIFFSAFIGKISELPVDNIILIRVIEYILVIILLCNLKISKDNIVMLLKFYVAFNIGMIILQKQSLIGSFTSIGYLSPDHPQNLRAIGLTGGSWELGVIFSLCYFILIKIEKPSLIRISIYFLIALIINVFSENRMNAIGFILANLFLFKNYLNTKTYILIFLSLLIVGSFFLLNYQDLNNTSLDRLMGTNYIDAFLLVRDYFLFLEIPNRDDLDTSLWSLYYRISLWDSLLTPYLENFFTVVFGGGPYRIYFESTILRVIFTTGLIGVVFVIYHMRKLELYLVVYFLTVGITLDIFNSFKIFSFTMLYYILLYENYSYRRNRH